MARDLLGIKQFQRLFFNHSCNRIFSHPDSDSGSYNSCQGHSVFNVIAASVPRF